MTNTGLEAVATGENVTVVADTMHGQADDQRIDAWELEASRRALTNLRELLFNQPMLDLLHEQITDADRRYKDYVAASNGHYTECQVILTITGLTASDFFPTIAASLQAADGTPEQRRDAAVQMLFPMHPEHYALPPYLGVIETMGGIPTRTRVARIADADAPEFVTACIDDTYPTRLVGTAELDDGTRHSYVLQQFADTPDGMEANLRIWYPAACPATYVEEHAKHYTVEFRNGCRMAAATLNHTT